MPNPPSILSESSSSSQEEEKKEKKKPYRRNKSSSSSESELESGEIVSQTVGETINAVAIAGPKVRETLSQTSSEAPSENTGVEMRAMKVANLERMNDEVDEFRKACQEEIFNSNKSLWTKGELFGELPALTSTNQQSQTNLFSLALQVLAEIVEFTESIECQIKYIDACLPKLAKFYIKYEESIDKQEVERMIKEKGNLNLGKAGQLSSV